MATRTDDQNAVCGCRVQVRLANYEDEYALAWPWLNRIEITQPCETHGNGEN